MLGKIIENEDLGGGGGNEKGERKKKENFIIKGVIFFGY